MVIATKIAHKNRYALNANSDCICASHFRSRFHASLAKIGIAIMKLSPLVSMKSWRVIDVGSI